MAGLVGQREMVTAQHGRILRRIEALIERIAPERLRPLRAIEALEHIGNSEAQELLKKLSQGAPEARLTQEAKASLERLSKR